MRPGLLVFRAAGPEASEAFRHEPGGHRWQRIPANDDRVHTSTVTVAVLKEPEEAEFYLNPADLDLKTTRGSGPGGQNRNKTESCVVLTHKPTGVVVRIDTERSQHRNRALALGVLRARLSEAHQDAQMGSANASRKAQVGSGMRGDKTWTIRVKDNQVTHHASGSRFSYDKYVRGDYAV